MSRPSDDDFPHSGIVVNLPNGTQVVVHKSKRFGGTVVTPPSVYSDGHPVRVFWTPPNEAYGEVVVQRALADVGPRFLGDNCQHYVTGAAFFEARSPGLEFAVKCAGGIALGVLALKALAPLFDER